jgi:predicted glycosyltransferase
MLACGDDFLVFDYRPDLVCFLGLAAASVSMAGYNTVCELLSLEVPAVLVPRVEPRVEQLLRARAFEKNGMVEVVEPHQLGPDNLETAVRRCLQTRESGQAGGLPEGVDFSGLRRMERQVRRHLERKNN